MEPPRERLLAWQWHHYPSGHRDRRNLVIHLATEPIFLAGTVALVTAPFTAWWAAPLGVVAMAGAMAAQGRGHRLEGVPPIPFAGPADVIGRIFLEQWVNFPRYVLTGGLAKAWREAVRR